MHARKILGLAVVVLAAGCAAHDAGAATRGHGAVDRSGDGWARTDKPAAKKTSATSAAASKPKAPPPPDAKTKPAQRKVAMLTPQKAAPDFAAKAVANGRAILAGTAAKPARQDCSGFVTAIYERAGLPLEISEASQKGTKSMAEMLYRTAKADGRLYTGGKPKPGDLVFYKNTFGPVDGRITHIAVVESVADDGTVTVIHNIGGRYRRSPMNLEKPHEPLKNGYFRKKQTANEPVLAGELFVAYARPG